MGTCTCGHAHDEHDAKSKACTIEGCDCFHYEDAGDDD